jgi:quinol-cytochrome oxidoreductase complex cytochrome b subunit
MKPARTQESNTLKNQKSFVLHVHPAKVPERTLDLTLTWGLGGMGLVLFLLLALTGILLLFVYEPSSESAYPSILYLQTNVPFGQWMRNIHYWSANLLLIVSFLHLLRVFFTGAFDNPRRLNWIIGLGLFFLIVFGAFTGYLLPWDQLAFWAVTISTGMLEYIPVAGTWLQKLLRGGEELGPSTLTIFFALHCAVVPLILILLMPFHFWRVRTAGGTVIPRSLEESPSIEPKMVPATPNLVVRELAVGAVLIALILLFSVLLDAPLEEPANPGLSPNPAKAPWYFMGVQELLMHVHPLFAVFVIPLSIVTLMVFLPYGKRTVPSPGVWFGSEKGRRMGVTAAAAALFLTTAWVLFDEYVGGIPLSVSAVVNSGLIPFVILVGVVVGFYLLCKRAFKASTGEGMQAVFILLLTGFLVLMVIGIFFRGPDMALGWGG